MISRGLPILGSFCKPLKHLPNLLQIENFDRYMIRGSSCSFICVKLVIHYLTCGFGPVISTRQNVISRGLLIFGSFCTPPKNVAAEAFAEPSENWEVSSNRILTGRLSGSTLDQRFQGAFKSKKPSSPFLRLMVPPPNFSTAALIQGNPVPL